MLFRSNAIPNRIEDYLVSKKIVTRCMTPNKIAERITHVFQLTSIRKILGSSNLEIKKKSKKMLNSMEEPYPILVKTMKSVLK